MNEIHDLSRVDAYARSRRRVAFLGAVWKPLLAGGVGAAITAATVMGSVWAILPKISTREIVIDHVVQRDKPFDVYIPHDKPFDNYVPVVVQRDAANHGPATGGPYEPSGPTPAAPTPSSPSSSSMPSSQPAAAPAASSPTAAGASPLIQDGPVSEAQSKPVQSRPDTSGRPTTPEEKKFTEKPDYRSATYRGRIVKSWDGRALSFNDGQNFWPAHLDDATRKAVDDLDDAVDSGPYVGDLGFCRPQQRNAELWDCFALHDGQQVEIPNRPSRPAVPQKSASASQSPSGSNLPAVASDNGMIFVKVDLGKGVSVNAMVDSGASWGMAIPSALADTLVAKNLAVRRPKPKGKTTFADGVAHEVGAISIRRIVVDGRVLENVEAAVVPNRGAPVLLGLGALNRLGAFTIENGKLVFTAAARAG